MRNALKFGKDPRASEKGTRRTKKTHFAAVSERAIRKRKEIVWRKEFVEKGNHRVATRTYWAQCDRERGRGCYRLQLSDVIGDQESIGQAGKIGGEHWDLQKLHMEKGCARVADSGGGIDRASEP